MLISTIILGWLGVLFSLLIAFSFQKLIKNEEYAFLHIVMAFMYAMWFPLPFTLNQLLKSELLSAGAIFGFVYLIMLVITMTLQTGHLTFIVKHNADRSISDTQGNYMMATISNPFEGLANIFKSIWAFYLGISFWNGGEMLMASLMFLFSLLFVYYLLLVLKTSLVRPFKLLSKIRTNPLFVNLETFLFFLTLMIYITCGI